MVLNRILNIKNRHKLYFKGIIDSSTKEVICGFQLERTNVSNQQGYNGFTDVDNNVLLLLVTFIGMKFSQMHELEISQAKNKELLHVLNGINELMAVKNCSLFFIKLREIFPSFVEYEYVGIYLYNDISKFWMKE